MAKITIVLEDTAPEEGTPPGTMGGMKMEIPELDDLLKEQQEAGLFTPSVLVAMTIMRKFEIEVLQREIMPYCSDMLSTMRMRQAQQNAVQGRKAPEPPAPSNDG